MSRAALLLMVFWLSGAPMASSDRTVTGYLGKHAVPLEHLDAGHGFADLEPLQEILKGVRIVGLGEATHGTREFFQFKHRMLEFLVERMGFDAFAIEASHVASLDINDYVVYGRGDRAAALAGLKFWTWDTQEISAMIDWMRAYNQDIPESRRIRFVGYDIQVYEQAFDRICAYLARVAPDQIAEAKRAFTPLKVDTDQEREAFGNRSPAQREADAARLRRLVAMFEDNRAAFSARSSREEYSAVLLQVRVLWQAHEAYGRAASNEKPPGSRDQFMAENIRSLLDLMGPDTKMVVWAHNGHIANDPDFGGGPSMGRLLRQWYGPAYYILGFESNRGTFQSLDRPTRALKEFTLPPAPEGSLAWHFEQVCAARGYRNFIVDFRGIRPGSTAARWLATPLRLTEIGAVFSAAPSIDDYRPEVNVGGQYDGMVFISETSRARPNPTGMRPRP